MVAAHLVMDIQHHREAFKNIFNLFSSQNFQLIRAELINQEIHWYQKHIRVELL